MKGNGFNISIDKGKIADEDYLKIRETLEQFAKEIVHNLHTDPTYPNIVSKVAGDILRE